MDDRHAVVLENSVSRAWARAFLKLLDAPGTGSTGPLIVSAELSTDRGIEDSPIRLAVDRSIGEVNRVPGHSRVETVEGTASTIFPRVLWTPHQPRPRKEVFDRYLHKLLPRIKARSQRNVYGTYFERMTNYRGSINQLDEILTVWERQLLRGRHPRISALQIACYDPTRDSRRAARRGFPCLHQVGLSYRERELAVHAWYPTEYIFSRGYGNYLGLARLGEFMAHEMGMHFAQLHCYVAHPLLAVPKYLVRRLGSEVRGILGLETP